MKKSSRKTFGNDLEALLSLSDLGRMGDIENGIESAFIEISKIIPGKYQPRKDFDEKSLYELADSISSNGIIQPLIVREISSGKYEIIAGERRWRAAKIAGLSEVPVSIKRIDDKTAMIFGVIENIQRKDLNPIEEAYSIKRLLNEFQITQEEASKLLGRSRAAITNMLRLLDLSDPVKNMLEAGKIQIGHAKVILPLSDELQLETAMKIQLKQLSVRATEILVKGLIQSKNKLLTSEKFIDDVAYELKKNLENRLPANISVQTQKGGGLHISLKVEYPEDVKHFIKILLTLPLIDQKEELV